MIVFLVAAVCVLSAAELRGGVTNSSAMGDAASGLAPESKEAIEREYRALVEADEAAEADVQKWLQAGNKDKNGKTDAARAALEPRIEAKLDAVRRNYEAFLGRRPRHVQALLAYGSFLQARHEEAGAQEQWEKVLEIEPGNADAHHNLACRYTEVGQVKKAFDYFTKAIALDPSQAVYYYNFANTLYVLRAQGTAHYKMSEQQIYAKILELYGDAMRLDPTNLAYATDRAQTYYAMRPFPAKDALVAWTETLACARTSLEREEILVHIARAKMLAGNLQEARSQLNLVTNETLANVKGNLLRAIASREAEKAEEKADNPRRE